MGTPFIGEVRMISFNFAPKGWTFCNGQLLPINQNQALFSILGTNYGGDGRVNFALPDLRSRAPIHTGSGFILGQKGGEEAHTLIVSEIAAHNHFVQGTTAVADQANPANNMLAQSTPASFQFYTTTATLTTLQPTTIGNAGGNQPHSNIQPYTAVNFIIALQGTFPSQN
jgi:microcystin-dependent protein